MTKPPPELDFRFVHEAAPGDAWLSLFREFWPAYRKWYYAPSFGAGVRPDYATCIRMLREHLPSMVPVHEALTELVGGEDDAARFLTLYCPPPSIRGCTQAVARLPAELGDGFALVRNYDFAPSLSDGVVLRSAWSGVDVIALSDCLIGALDGMNEHGLVASLAFGGDRIVGEGFGAPMLVRAVLECCATVAEATRMLRSTPVHMAYTLTLLDAAGAHATVYLRPNKDAEVSRDAVATNHQGAVVWPEHARFTQTIERRCEVKRLLAGGGAGDGAAGPIDAFELARLFLAPPLFRQEYAKGSGTLYTAVYAPATGTLDLLWPDAHRRVGFETFEAAPHVARYAQAHAPAR